MMDRRKQLGMAVAGLAVVALVVDQYVLSPPEDVAASDAAMQVEATTTPSASANGSANTTGDNAVAVRLGAYSPRANGDIRRDVFRIPQAWLPAKAESKQTVEIKQPIDEAAEAKRREAEAQRKQREAFRQGHKLTAVIMSGQGDSVAVINGEAYRVGMSVGGFDLTHIAQRKVLLRGAAGDIALELDEDQPK